MAEKEFVVDEGRDSKFNSGILQTQRTNKHIDIINVSRCNPIAFNMEYSDYNYILWMRNLDIIYSEICAFMTEDERTKCKNTSRIINNIIDKYPIYDNRKRKDTPNKELWVKLRRALEIYDEMLRLLGVKYKALATTMEDDYDL